jgi:DNA-binding transcriptional MerR regulator/methylmalonyl-CoA mutase cobalamin-binding subunit
VNETSELLYPIRVVARRTGLKPDTIRVWEKRYGAVKPTRTSSRRRRYSEGDVERLRLLAQATRAGWRIGEVVALPHEELRRLIAEEGRGASAAETTPLAASPGDASATLEAALEAVRSLDGEALRRELEKAATELGRRRLLDELVGPLLEAVGDSWESGGLRTAHEHLATATVRSFLGALRGGRFGAGAKGPLLLASTPPGQLHEMGALLAAAAAEDEGWRVVYLGPNLPAEEIAMAAEQRSARVVALSLTHPSDDPEMGPELLRLRRILPSATALLIGGRAAPSYARAAEAAEVVVVDTLESLRERLRELRRPTPS